MLLVERDLTGLIPAKGLVHDTSLPSFLATPWVVLPEFSATEETHARELENILLFGQDKQKKVKKYAGELGAGGMLGYWSGFRSVIVHDAETGLWYKLKGVAPNLEKLQRRDRYSIWGTQKLVDAELEWKMSERFNHTLEAEGVEPVMRVRGTWHYPGRVAGMRPTATIAEVKGDTRLDELLAALDVTAYLTGEVMLMEAPAFSRFYGACGYAVGQVMRIMHQSGQAWGTSGDQTNAHLGNVVVYREKGRLWFGLVDFDISADAAFYSRAELDQQQREEIRNVRAGLLAGDVRSARPLAIHWHEELIWTENFYKGNRRYASLKPRCALANGFTKGYASTRTYRTSIDIGLLYDVTRCIEDARSKQAA